MSQSYAINISGDGKLNAVQVGVGPNVIQTYSNVSQQEIEIVAEIEQLLKHIEEKNLGLAKHEQANINDVILTPGERLVAALKSGGETAIDELVLENKYHKIIKSIVKGWLQSK
jgi:uncharacterized protein YqfA (UPF0365 family)